MLLKLDRITSSRWVMYNIKINSIFVLVLVMQQTRGIQRLQKEHSITLVPITYGSLFYGYSQCNSFNCNYNKRHAISNFIVTYWFTLWNRELYSIHVEIVSVRFTILEHLKCIMSCYVLACSNSMKEMTEVKHALRTWLKM